ncbi:MAG: hypothetical protein E5Y12_28460 [Mesorhizobium sp.]|nr:MAG: hypothetical protein E5Y12_28460 [Mesorhizobium sp.]
MPRYATIITGDDGREVVSAIGEFEGAAPQVRLGRVEQVAPGVLIGMVRNAAGGFCFAQAGVDGRAVGLAMARLKAQASVAKPARAAKPAEAARPKRARKARKKITRSKKPARRARPALPKATVSSGDANTVGHAND